MSYQVPVRLGTSPLTEAGQGKGPKRRQTMLASVVPVFLPWISISRILSIWQDFFFSFCRDGRWIGKDVECSGIGFRDVKFTKNK